MYGLIGLALKLSSKPPSNSLKKVTPILGCKAPYFYRNKMEFSFSDSRWLTLEEIQSDRDLGDRNALGFHIPGMWDKILDIKKCHLQADPSNAIRNAVREFAIANELEFSILEINMVYYEP